MPARTSGPKRSMSRTRTPSRAFITRSLRASVASSVEPWRRKRRLASASEAIWRRVARPLRYEARANWNAEDPAISVRSRSKKAAARPATALGAVDLDDDGVALAAAGADRGDARAAAAA